MNSKLIFVILLSVIVAGCGYTTGSLLPTHIQTIYVEPFKNRIELTDELTTDEYRFRSYRVHLETDITKEVIRKFINDGHLKVVRKEEADVILSGELVDYLRQPLRYGADNEVVAEYRVSIVCSAQFRDIAKDELIWNEPRIIGDSTYNISGTYSVTESATVASAVSDVARRIVNRAIEGW